MQARSGLLDFFHPKATEMMVWLFGQTGTYITIAPFEFSVDEELATMQYTNLQVYLQHFYKFN
jgi:hypothetical protein